MSNDLDLIAQLEMEIGKKLKKLELGEIEKETTNGFAVNENGEIIGLNLDELKSDSLPMVFSKFQHLKCFSLVGTEIKDYSILQSLSNLVYLNLRDNSLTDISFLQGLINLRELYLGSNELTDISFLQGLKNLKILDLIGNRIKELPEKIFDLGIEIDVKSDWTPGEGIYLYGNPLETPPPEIVRKGREAIEIYFDELKKGKELPLNEVKVLLVGDGGAGKTSLVNRLLGWEFDKDEARTDGINIEPWIINDNETEIKVHLWDFGGQEIMHATHQFFLSKRSLYILVLDGRKDEKTEYWLKHIESFGGDSPVLVVINKIDANPGFEVNRKFLKDKYKYIKGFFRVSCKTGEGMDVLVPAFKAALLQIEILKTTWAESWFNVKSWLEKMKEHFISYEEYIKICEEKNIYENSNQDTLVDFLNDLGVILHFKDFGLEDTHVLDPEWVTGAVYRIINSGKLASSKGVLNLNVLGEILKKKGKDDYKYPLDKHKYIIQLMKKFELCYKIDRQQVLIPDLLDVEESEFDFDYKGSLKFIFEYDFLPKSVMPRFIVRRHKDIKNGLKWRTGVVLEDKAFNATAVVKSDDRDRRIYIYVNGEQKRDYFSIIRKTLKDINDTFEKLETTELVPLPENNEITVKYGALIGHERANRIEYFDGDLQKSFTVKQLLDGLVSEDERRTDYEKMPIIFLSVNQENKQQQFAIQKQETNVSVTVDLEIELPAIQFDFSELKGLLGEADLRMENELDKIEDSLDEVSADSDKEKLKKPFNKLGRLLKKLGDENSDFNKILKGTKRGVEMARKVARTYSKFAPWLGLPAVPQFLLGEEKAKE